MEFGSRLPRDKLETSRVCLEEVAVMESGLYLYLSKYLSHYLYFYLSTEVQYFL
jgi:hypothetical protein